MCPLDDTGTLFTKCWYNEKNSKLIKKKNLQQEDVLQIWLSQDIEVRKSLPSTEVFPRSGINKEVSTVKRFPLLLHLKLKIILLHITPPGSS